MSARLAAALTAAVLVLAAVVAAVPHAHAEVDLADKRITLIVPFKRGGGTDRWARFWAPLISEALPGTPTIRVKNVVGGGSTKGANEFYAAKDTEGLTLLASSASVMYPFLLGDKRARYDYADWTALLVSPTGGVVYCSPELVFEYGDELRLESTGLLKMAVQGPTQLGLLMMLSVELLGYEYHVDFGSGGSSSKYRTFREGFTNIDMQTTASYLTNVQRLVRDGEAVPLFSFGTASPDGRIGRDRNFPKIPHFVEFYKDNNHGAEPSGPAYEAWAKLFYAGFPTQKILVIHKDTDPEVLAAYQKAVSKVMSEPENWPDTKEEILGNYPQYHGQDAQQLMDEASIPPEVTAWVKEWIKTRSGITI